MPTYATIMVSGQEIGSSTKSTLVRSGSYVIKHIITDIISTSMTYGLLVENYINDNCTGTTSCGLYFVLQRR